MNKLNAIQVSIYFHLDAFFSSSSAVAFQLRQSSHEKHRTEQSETNRERASF